MKYHQEILFVELETSLEERLRRNRTENRLKYKPLKRYFEVSEREILETDKTNQLNSQKRPSGLHHYLKIDNTNLSAEEVAKQMQQTLELCKDTDGALDISAYPIVKAWALPQVNIASPMRKNAKH